VDRESRFDRESAKQFVSKYGPVVVSAIRLVYDVLTNGRGAGEH
jgi:hypothetical protein